MNLTNELLFYLVKQSLIANAILCFELKPLFSEECSLNFFPYRIVWSYFYLAYCVFRLCLQFKLAKVAKEGESAISKGLCLDKTKDVEAGIFNIVDAKQEA